MENYIKQGDLIIFDNKHKLYCGDSTKPDSYLGMESCAEMTLTSPPYNIGKNNCGTGIGGQTWVGGGNKYKNSTDNVDDEEYLNLIYTALTMGLRNSKYVFWNTAHTRGNKISLLEFLYRNKEKFVDTIIWEKMTTQPAMEPRVMNTDFEYIYIFTALENNGRHIKIGNEFHGNISDVCRFKRNYQNEYSKIHGALMTFDLADYLIKTFTCENDLVLDVFSGLGTTLLACEKNNRRYYGIEIEPYYCEKTIERYFKNHTGKFDVKIFRDGKEIGCDEVRELAGISKQNLFEF